MKINNTKVEPPKATPLVIPKGNTEYVFKFKVVQTADFDEFERMCPKPKPPHKTSPTKGSFYDTDDKKYKAAFDEYIMQFVNYRFLASIAATEGLDFETVDNDDPTTWGNYKTELLEAGFTDIEIAHMINTCGKVQGLTAAQIEQATQSFLARKEGKL